MAPAPIALLPQSDPKVVCGTIKLCQPRGSPEGALKFQEPPPAPAQDFAELTIPVIAGVPLLLQPQDTPRAQVPARPCQHPAIGVPSLLITSLILRCRCHPAGAGGPVWGLRPAGGGRADGAGCLRPLCGIPCREGVRGLGTRPGTAGNVTVPGAQSRPARGGGIQHGVKPLGAQRAPFSPHSASATWLSTRTRLPGCSGTW